MTDDEPAADEWCKDLIVAFLQSDSRSEGSFVSKQQLSQLNFKDIKLTTVEWSRFDL